MTSTLRLYFKYCTWIIKETNTLAYFSEVENVTPTTKQFTVDTACSVHDFIWGIFVTAVIYPHKKCVHFVSIVTVKWD
jgi:hypothetical protein